MTQPKSSLLGLLIIGALLCIVVAGLGSLLSSVHAANNTLHEFRGTVHSISPGDTPPVIVVKSLYGSKEEVVIGAMIKTGASILRGKKKIALEQIRPGDNVTVKYVKTREGLTIRSIILHRN